MKKSHKVLCVGCAVGVMAASMSILCGAAINARAMTPLDESDVLRAKGRLLYNARGERVVLRGVNLGGWLLQEAWMSPNNGVDKQWGYHDTLTVLTERFGAEEADALLTLFMDNWITERDLDYLKDLGVNCVRLPFWYRNLHIDDNGTWRRDADGNIDFSRLDRIVDACGKRGIYVVLDLHGAPGFQSDDHPCGKVDASELFDVSLAGLRYRRRTAELWTAVATHYRDNPVIAAYDLLNEPMSGFTDREKNDAKLWRLYDKLYTAVRAADPDRLITVQGIWDMENLPDPACFGWENIVYQLHIYNWSTPEIDKKIADIRARNHWNVPVMVGEFQAGGIWDYTLSAFNNNDLSWFTWTYKGVKTEKSDWFLFAADIPVANLQEDSYEEIAAKWGAPCRTENGFIENTDLSATLRAYLPGGSAVDSEDPDIPQTGGVSPVVPAAAAAALAGTAARGKKKKH